MKKELESLMETLSPIERKIIPYLKKPFKDIVSLSGLEDSSVLLAIQFLEKKGIITAKSDTKKVIELGTNGVYYKKNNLPERTLMLILEKQNRLSLEEAKKLSKLSENEFKVALGVLKDKALLTITNGKLFLNASKEELSKKLVEEKLLDALPLEESALGPEQKLAFSNLKKRKEIIELKTKTDTSITLTELGKELAGKEINLNLLEEVTSEVIKSWSNGKKFRRYDIKAQVPKIYGGKKHFVNQSIEYAKRIWTDLGFTEMTGNLIDSSFWVFDALFTPQDHPAREMQDTFFIKNTEAKLPEQKIVKSIKQAHESGISGSKGWNYDWKEKDAKKVLLRTHTTSLSARKLTSLKSSEIPAKYFAIGKVFRNETIDWSHGFEFYQTEGIVIDPDASLRNLLGYLKEFYKKMGYEKIKFVPSFFAYTEPSVEIQVWHPERKLWLELGGAGIFRPEVTAALLGKPLPVLAWGQGFDRIITEYYKIKDLREMYSNDLKDLRNKKEWIK